MLNQPTKKKKKKIMKPQTQETKTNESDLETSPEVATNLEETIENFIDLSDSQNDEAPKHGADLNISEPELDVLDKINNLTEISGINSDLILYDDDYNDLGIDYVEAYEKSTEGLNNSEQVILVSTPLDDSENFKSIREMENTNNDRVVEAKDLPRKNKHFRNPDGPQMSLEEIKQHGTASSLIIGHTKETLNPMAAKMMAIKNSKPAHIRKRI